MRQLSIPVSPAFCDETLASGTGPDGFSTPSVASSRGIAARKCEDARISAYGNDPQPGQPEEANIEAAEVVIALNAAEETRKGCCLRSEASLPPALAYDKGLEQKFPRSDEVVPAALTLPQSRLQELLSLPAGGDRMPVVIRLEALTDEGRADGRDLHSLEPGSELPHWVQTQTTYARVLREEDGSLGLRVVKQKVWVKGEAYELQEIYGMEQNKGVAMGLPATATGDGLEEVDGNECVICLSASRDTAALPCRHMCMCHQCASALKTQPRMKACSKRAVIGSLLLGFLVRGLFTIHVADPLGLHGQPVYTDIPVSQAAIPDLSCRNLCLQLCRGLPGDRANTRPNAAVAAVLTAHPDLRARLEAIPRYRSDSNMVDHVGKQLKTAFSNMLTLLFAGRLKKSVSLAGAKVLVGINEHQRRFGFMGLGGEHLPAWSKRQCTYVRRMVCGLDVSWLLEEGGVVVTATMQAEVALQQGLLGHEEGEQVDHDWVEEPTNRGRLLRQAQQSEVTNPGLLPRPPRPPTSNALTPNSECQARHVFIDTKGLYGMMRDAGMLGVLTEEGVTSLLKFSNGALPDPRPTELCRWEGRPAMPKPGQPDQEWVYLPDKALLRKWRRKWQR
ncbi:hypothetical protein QJQ45_009736 [Haematococcus lacustris]|nr:hypothetical protein QJQ45_009736 [Haematococcus lacustris]